jgi:hypothetical protein
MKQTRRHVLRSSIAIALGGTIAGCLGGSGGGGNNSSNSTNGTGASGSTNQPAGAEGTSDDATTAGATTSQSGTILGAEPEFNRQEMTIDLSSETPVDHVSLQTSKNKEFAVYEPTEYENTATFTLIESSAKQFGYKPYPFGTWTATALRNGSKVDERTYELNPSFSVTGVDARSGKVQVTFENIGSAPAPITAARIYKVSMNPGPNEFGGGYVDSQSITAPGDTITVDTRLMGFDNQFSLGENKSASDYEGEYCTGSNKPVTISHRVFSEVRETTGSLVFGGRPIEGPQGNVVCSEYTLNAVTNNANTTGNATGMNASNRTAANGSTVSFTTTGGQSTGSSGTTASETTAANQSQS